MFTNEYDVALGIFMLLMAMLIFYAITDYVVTEIKTNKKEKKLHRIEIEKQEERNKQAFMQNWINCTMKTED
jgi:hypothetical protein